MPQLQPLPPDYTVEEPPEAADRLTPPPSSSVDNPDFPAWATAWWDANVTSRVRANSEGWAQRAQWQRALQRRQPVEVAATYPRGIQASLRVHRDPVHPVFPHRRQEHEVGLAASWLSRLGDGVTADLETSSRAGQFASVTAATALDSQRHAIGEAAAQGGSLEAPSIKLQWSNRQHNLLLSRTVEHCAAAAYDTANAACQLSSSTSIRCCGDALTLTAVAGTDLTNTDAGFEAVLTPQAPLLPLPPPVAVVTAGGGGGGGARRGLQKAMLAAVSSLDGVGKNLSLESSHCVADNGAKLDASLESREAEGVRGLLRPQSWGLKLTSPAAAGTKSLCVSIRSGAAELAPSLSARLNPRPDGSGDGLSLGASCGLSSGSPGPALEAEWRSGCEEEWVSGGSRSLVVSAEVRRDWASSRANFDVLLMH